MLEKKQRGRPKKPVSLSNGIVTADELFTYVPKDTIPVGQVERFISLCDHMIYDLDPEELSSIDIEEIALYCREKIYCDLIYKNFAEAQATDTSLVIQIEKINKNLEKRKENLGARFIDKGKKRKEAGTESLIDLLEKFSEYNEQYMDQAENKKIELTKDKDNKFTKTSEYMESHLSVINNIIKK